MTVTTPLQPSAQYNKMRAGASNMSSFSRIIFMGLLVTTLLVSCGPNDEKVSENVKSSVSVLDPSIQVSVKDGVVTLSGQVADASTKNAAESSIKEVKGVKSVVNNITVKEESMATTPAVIINPDDAVRHSVDSAFTAKGIAGITAAVNNGEVTLTGNVKRADLKTVMQAANEAHPKRVINKLTIK